MATDIAKKIEQAAFKAAKLVSKIGYPTSWEKLEVDENNSLWASYTPNYQATAPLNEDIDCDLAIIGGGFTGVSTAYHFSQRFPEKRVVLLEAKSLANGASGRNGGMMLNWVYGTGSMSDVMTKRVYQSTLDTIDGIEAIIQKHNLKVSYRRDGCFEVFTDAKRAEEAEADAKYYQSLGIPIQWLTAEQARQKIDLEGIYGGLLDPTEGQLNGVEYLRELRPVLQEQGVQVFENTPVTNITEGETIRLETPKGSIKTKAIVLATNGYTGKLGYFRKSYFPLHSHVFSTKAQSDTQLDAMGWHSTAAFADDLNRISYASKTREGHIVFGGGSNLSYDYKFNNRTVVPNPPARAFTDMRSTLTNYLPQTKALEISHKWTGLLAISLRRNCSMGVMGDHKNIYYSLGYSGHGLTAANMAGRVLTDIYSGYMEQWQGLPFVESEFSPIPLEPFRWMGYQMFTRLTGKSPREHHR